MATEYVRLCGYEHGEIGNGREKNCQVGKPKYTLDEIAEQLGTSQRSLSRALSIERNLTEPMKELLDTGVISKTLAADVIAGLTPEEQEELIAVLPVTERITRREMEKYIEEIKELKIALRKSLTTRTIPKSMNSRRRSRSLRFRNAS